MKIIKAIFYPIWCLFHFICFIFKRILIIILILVLLLIRESLATAIIYGLYNETGVMINGNLCISHMCEGAGSWMEKYYNSDENVLEEVKDFAVGGGSSNAGKVFGKVYKPVNSGTSNIYVGYATFGGDDIRYFELYHVEVDKDLNITYTMETITKEEFEENTIE